MEKIFLLSCIACVAKGSRDHVVKKNKHISQHYSLITIIIEVSEGRTASYAAITKNVAVKV